ncbi:MAG TPA: SCP2 sterol-binding domain-containing protein [Acidimicrobiales bacterium]|nr:SCP2 sterol-binding domain-containing protein [Acidimicrobiales bacterium]
MPRFLSSEWVDAFDAALSDVVLPDLGEDAGIAASGGRFTVAQNVHGGPDGEVTLLLTVDAGSLRMALVDAGNSSNPRPDVTIVVSYQDAAALSTGELRAADAITAGRIRVRGDLSVLAAGQAMLVAAQPHIQSLAAATTY